MASHYQKGSPGTLLQVEFQCVVTVKLCCGSVKIPLGSASQEESASHNQCQLLPCYFCCWTAPWYVLRIRVTPRFVRLISWTVKHDLDVSTNVVANWRLPVRGLLRGSTICLFHCLFLHDAVFFYHYINVSFP